MIRKIVSLLVVTLVLAAWIHGGGWAPFTIDVAALVTSPVTVNGLYSTCLTNPADTLASNTNWTPLSTQYLLAPTASQFAIKAKPNCYARDVEVATWARQGYTYLRLDATGKAIYFLHNGETTNGTLEIGIVTGLDENSYPSGTYYPLYSNTDLVHTIPGNAYNITNTTGATFTFGVSGFDIYAKFNGVQFVTFQDYRQMSSGAVALKANAGSGYGFRNITVSQTTQVPLFSAYAQGQLDLRDFGLRSIQTTGTIAAASTSLTLAAAQNFRVNDFIIVEIGGETGAGLRGTTGVGGVWPALKKANKAALDLDTTEALNTFGWVQDTGTVYEWNGSAWSTTFACSNCSSTAYYTQLAVPMSLVARITAISPNGLTLTLDTAASVTATNANVYLDNQLTLNNLTQAARGTSGAITPSNLTLVFPAGTFAFGGRTNVEAHSGWTIQGQGQGTTTLMSPGGVFGAGILADINSPSFTAQNFTLSGNLAHNNDAAGASRGFGLNWPTVIVPIPASSQTTEYDSSGKILTALATGSTVTQTSNAIYYFTSGITMHGDNSVAQNLTINDVFTDAIQCQDAHNCWAYNIAVNVNSVRQTYTQWQLEWAGTTGGGCQNCTINSLNIVQGFENFGSNTSAGPQFINPTSVNAAFSLNAAGTGWLISGANVTFNIGAQTLAGAWVPGNGMITVNSNTGGSAAGSIVNSNFTQTGYLNGYVDGGGTHNNNVEIGINVTAQVPGINVTGGTYTAPNYTATGNPRTNGAVGIISQADNTTVDGFKACGTVATPGDATGSNIVLDGATGSTLMLRNSIYDSKFTTSGATLSGNTTPCP